MTEKYNEILGVLTSKGIDSNDIDKHIKSLRSRRLEKHIKLVGDYVPEINDMITCLKKIDASVFDHTKQYRRLIKPLELLDKKKMTDEQLYTLDRQYNESLLKSIELDQFIWHEIEGRDKKVKAYIEELADVLSKRRIEHNKSNLDILDEHIYNCIGRIYTLGALRPIQLFEYNEEEVKENSI